jgi:hypothetical protein
MSGGTDAKKDWVERVLGVRFPPAVQSAGASGAAMKVWQAERAKAVASLRALATEIVKSRDPEAQDAVLLLQAIVKNLTPIPDSLRSVAELERYLAEDDIIDDAEEPNPFGIDLKLRAPLLPALAGLRRELEAAGG